MSFGWSAGDIATAVSLVYKLIKALDSCDGSAGDYREAVSFLQHLTRTLKPLETFTALNTYPEYGQDIREQVAHIKEPVKKFLATVSKFESSLGSAQKGHHRHVLRKLEWYILVSSQVLVLRKKIESHMRVIDTLMQRLTLDVICAMPQILSDNLRTRFEETFPPELIAVLRENLLPLNTTIHEYQELHAKSHSTLVSKLSESNEILSSGVEEIKQLSSFIARQNCIEPCFRGNISRGRQTGLPTLEDCQHGTDTTACLDEDANMPANELDAKMAREYLSRVYYLVFLSLGYFLRDFFLMLARLVQPSRALTQILPAKYNILFLDAIGGEPRVLPYEYFCSFNVFQAFIQDKFKNRPGAAWIKRGKYLLSNFANNQVLNEHNWGNYVTPGTTVAMSIVARTLLAASKSAEIRCFDISCPGRWAKSETQSWMKCPVCKKEVMYFSNNSDQPSSTTKVISHRKPHSHHRRRQSDLDEEDIFIFKRVVQQILDLKPDPLDLLLERAAIPTPFLERAREAVKKTVGKAFAAPRRRGSEPDAREFPGDGYVQPEWEIVQPEWTISKPAVPRRRGSELDAPEFLGDGFVQPEWKISKPSHRRAYKIHQEAYQLEI